MDQTTVPETDTATETRAAESSSEEIRSLLSRVKTREEEFRSGWWKDAEQAEKLYNMETHSQGNQTATTPYNILYSNTEVLLPSLLSSPPRPDVRTKFKDMRLGPIPEVVERFLTALTDPADPGTENLMSAMLETVLSALVPGMGYARLRYYPDRPMPLCIESGYYKNFIWAKARKWPKVGWVAFKHELTKEDFFSQFGVEPEDQPKLRVDADAEGSSPTVCVYEVWRKADRKVYFLSDDWQEKVIKVEDDPMQLEGFFPVPGPLTMVSRPGKLEPITLYKYYHNQAEELNRVTTRLNKVLEAIRVRGAYNGLLGPTLEQLLSSNDLENGIVPVQEGALLFQNGGFDRNIWLLPIEKLIVVAQQLYVARQQIKQVIYELTGISDIIRGSSVASETATAQDLKNKWGTIRLRKMQHAVAAYIRDLYRLSVDCASSVVPPEKWKEIVQLPIPLQSEKAQAQQQLAMFAQAQVQRQAQAQITGQPPAPPQPPPPQLLQITQSPSFEELLSQIANDQNRTFLVDVESSSTVDLDTAVDKAEVTEFMGAMAQLVPALSGLTQIGPTGMNAAKEILLSVCSRFKFGITAAEAIRKIEMQPPPDQDGAEGEKAKAAAEAEIAKLDLELAKQKHAAEMEKLAQERELAVMKAAVERQRLTLEMQTLQMQQTLGGSPAQGRA